MPNGRGAGIFAGILKCLTIFYSVELKCTLYISYLNYCYCRYHYTVNKDVFIKWCQPNSLRQHLPPSGYAIAMGRAKR